MSGFSDELRKLHATPSAQPIRSREEIKRDVDKYYETIKYNLRQRVPYNGQISIRMEFHLIESNYQYRANFNEDRSSEYNVHGRRTELLAYIEELKERCAMDEVHFCLTLDRYPARKYRYMKMETIDEILNTSINSNSDRYVAEFRISI